jgi:hypothetical protein
MIEVYLFVALLKGFDPAGMAAGLVLRDGVIAAVRVAPLIAGASVLWVVLVRRSSRRRPDEVRSAG